MKKLEDLLDEDTLKDRDKKYRIVYLDKWEIERIIVVVAKDEGRACNIAKALYGKAIDLQRIEMIGII